MTDGPTDQMLWQRVAEAELAAATHSRDFLLEAHQDAYKWLTASLLAINSGGILATLNATSGLAQFRVAAGLLFYLGMMAALLSQYLSQRAGRLTMAPLGALMGYWISVVHSGEHSQEMWEKLNEDLQDSVKKALSTQIAGWASAILFSAGVALLGMSILHISLPTVCNKPVAEKAAPK